MKLFNRKPKQSSKEEQYEAYADNPANADTIRDTLLYIQKSDFLLHEPNYITNYFEARGLPYSTEKDVDLLSRAIAAKLDSQKGTKTKDVIDERIGKKELERIIATPEKPWTEDLSRIYTLKDPIEKLAMTLYKEFEQSEEKIVIIKSIKTPFKIYSADLISDLFFEKKSSSIRFGYCSGNTLHWPGESYSSAGVEFKVKKSLFGEYKIKMRWSKDHSVNGNKFKSKRIYNLFFPDYDKITECKFEPVNSLLNKIQLKIESNSSDVGSYLQHLEEIFALPKLFKEGMKQNDERIKEKVQDVLLKFKSMQKVEDHKWVY